MAHTFSGLASVLALGVVFFGVPTLLGTTSPFTINSAFAKQGGNGKGNGNGTGNGNASKSEKSSSTKSEKTEKNQRTAKAPQANLSTTIDPLNVANASADAFAKAPPDSRIGKLKAYYTANQAALKAKAAAEEIDAAAMRGAFENSSLPSVVSAYEALQADPANPALQDAYNQVVTNAVLTGEQIAAVESAYSEWRAAIESDTLAAKAALAAEAALYAAANKTVVSSETRMALDALLAGKIN